MSKFSRLPLGLTIPRSGGVNYGDIVAQISVRPTRHMLHLAETAGVPGGNGYAPGDTYDAVQVALYWAQVGKVMPLKSPDEMFRDGDDISQGGKIPAFKGGQYEQGTRDPEEIKRIWSDDPGRGIGLPTQANRVLAIDVDNGPDKSGELNFVEMCTEIGVDLTEVPCSKSPSYHGGYHLFWKLPNSFPRMGLPAVSSIAAHVDIPWFVVVAGSWKHTTFGYDRKGVAKKGVGVQTWYAGDPLSLPMAPKPLLDKLMRRGVIKGVPATEQTSVLRARYKTDTSGTIDIEHYDKNGIEFGQQNVVLYRIACKMAGRSMNLPKHDAINWCWDIISRSPSDSYKGAWSRYQVESLVDGAYTWVNADNAAADAANEELLRNWTRRRA